MKGQKSNWLRLSSIGFQIAASLLLFGWLGDFIDNQFDTNPIFLVIGLIFGATASLYQIWKMIDVSDCLYIFIILIIFSLAYLYIIYHEKIVESNQFIKVQLTYFIQKFSVVSTITYFFCFFSNK